MFSGFMQYKKSIIAIVALAVAGVAVVLFLFWLTSPRRALDAFLGSIKDGKQSAALSYISDDIKPERRDNIELFLDDWTSAKEITFSRSKEESWRAKGENAVDDSEESDVATRVEQIPTPKYWAHYYEAHVTLSFDGYEDPVVIKFKRQTDNAGSRFAQLFRGWKIARIRYQPISDADLGVEDFELNTEDLNADDAIEFEVDDEGNVVPSNESGEEGTTEDSGEGAANTNDEGNTTTNDAI